MRPARRLSGHPDIDFISFTGSAGDRSACWCSRRRRRSHMPGCTLELGGKSPQIVFADADIEGGDSVVGAIMQNAGQTCSAGSRALIRAPASTRSARPPP
jgi:aldehyde dehydrogenase (NAD+)